MLMLLLEWIMIHFQEIFIQCQIQQIQINQIFGGTACECTNAMRHMT